MPDAHIVFTVGGRRYVYDGCLPEAVFRDDFQYPEVLEAEEKEPWDTLPTARWEIAQIGGRIVAIHGQRPSGAILGEDWRHPLIQ